MEEAQHNFEENITSSQNLYNDVTKDKFLLNLNGYEGAIDLLLDLAKRQKVDLAKISILELAEQYLNYVENIQELNLEIAAEYLVMAAWLALLKSKLLLPDEEVEEISGEELSEALKFQLKRLHSMREAGNNLFKLKLLYIDRFPRGMTSKEKHIIHTVNTTTLNDLLFSYSNVVRGKKLLDYTPPENKLESIESALKRLNKILSNNKEWKQLSIFLPDTLLSKDKVFNNSILAATFSATLELAKKGQIEIRQVNPFGDIFIRAKE